jgi:hypothetical protein
VRAVAVDDRGRKLAALASDRRLLLRVLDRHDEEVGPT